MKIHLVAPIQASKQMKREEGGGERKKKKNKKGKETRERDFFLFL